jgi:uncharacterized membrane protein YfcA
MNLALAAVGLLVGICVGLTGVGGSSLMTPILLLFFGYSPAIAIGTDLAYSVPTKLVGAWAHWKQGTVDVRTVTRLCLAGIPGVLLGLTVLFVLRLRLDTKLLDADLRRGVAVALFISATAMTLSALFGRFGDGGLRARIAAFPMSLRLSVIGFAVGVLLSITSIGSGSLTLPLLYAFGPALAIKRLVGTDVAFAALVLPLAALGHLSMGNVDLTTSLTLLVGSIPGVLIGARLARRVPEKFVRPAVVGVMLLAGSRLL